MATDNMANLKDELEVVLDIPATDTNISMTSEELSDLAVSLFEPVEEEENAAPIESESSE